MDTNHDGVLTIQDDPYSPFYPGKALAACSIYQCTFMPDPSHSQSSYMLRTKAA